MSQNKVPLHKLPSSCPAQSWSLLHAHELAPPVHTPPEHASPLVHGLPSSQLAVLLLWVQPSAVLQASLVHPLLSVQTTATLMAVPLQAPAPQTSPLVHALLSLQLSVLLA